MELGEAVKKTKDFIFKKVSPLAEAEDAREIREGGDRILEEIGLFVKQVLRQLGIKEKEKYCREMQECVRKVQSNFLTGFGNDYIFYGLYGQIGVLFLPQAKSNPNKTSIFSVE